jgi:cytochrome c peroxidase
VVGWLVAVSGAAQQVHAQVGCAQSLLGPVCDNSTREERAMARDVRCQQDPRVQLGQVSREACLGADLFFRETFGGNGRTCGSCHPAQNNYTLDAPYIASLQGDDPLFVAEREPTLAELERSSLLRDFGLVLVNADGFEAPTTQFVMRSVSHMLALNITTTAPPLEPPSTILATDGTLVPPLERLGWGGDGAPGHGELRDFADGAIRQHMTRSLARMEGSDFVLPNDAEREAIAEFSRNIGRTNELSLSRIQLRDPAAERGRSSFISGNARECSSRCHINAGANSDNLDAAGQTIGLSNASFDIGTALIPLPQARALGGVLDGGFGTKPLDLDGDGVNDSFGNGGMNPPPLVEAADTLPLFHSHAFGDLEAALRFYASSDFAHSFVASTTDFDNRDFGEPMPLSEQDISDVGRFLRVLNSALNCQMTLARLQAAGAIIERFGAQHTDVVLGLTTLAAAEIEDALQVLGAVEELAPDAQRMLAKAQRELREPEQAACHVRPRAARIERAQRLVERAYRSLGSGLDMTIGQGTLLF